MSAGNHVLAVGLIGLALAVCGCCDANIPCLSTLNITIKGRDATPLPDGYYVIEYAAGYDDGSTDKGELHCLLGGSDFQCDDESEDELHSDGISTDSTALFFLWGYPMSGLVDRPIFVKLTMIFEKDVVVGSHNWQDIEYQKETKGSGFCIHRCYDATLQAEFDWSEFTGDTDSSGGSDGGADAGLDGGK
jgi:hypothetical protein